MAGQFSIMDFNFTKEFGALNCYYSKKASSKAANKGGEISY